MNNEIFYFFYNLFPHQSVFWNGVIYFFAEILPYVAVAFVGFFYYVVSDPDNGFEGFLQKHSKPLVNVFFSGIIAYALSLLLKILIHTERPFKVLRDVEPLFQETGYAFPSGHTAVAAALAFALFFINKKVGYVFMILALLIGLARIIAGVHFPIDILGGFVLGALVSYLVAYFRKNI